MTPNTHVFSKTRQTIAILLFLAIAGTTWLLVHTALEGMQKAPVSCIVQNPGYQHSQRLDIATTRAALDVLGMTSATPDAARYRADYQRQRMQMQADAEGLERWAARDARRQGLLLEIRSSLAGLKIALDQASGSATPSSNAPPVALLPALERAHRALNNYSASLSEPGGLQSSPYLLAGPMRLWGLLVLLLVEVAGLAWLFFAAAHAEASASVPDR